MVEEKGEEEGGMVEEKGEEEGEGRRPHEATSKYAYSNIYIPCQHYLSPK